MFAIVRAQLRRHALHLSTEEKIQKKRLENIVAMVTQRDTRGAKFPCHTIQNAAPQTRTQRTHGLALGDEPLHGRVGVLHLDPEGNAKLSQVVGQYVFGIARMALVQIDCDQLEINAGAAAQLQKNIQETVAVLATGEADHDPVALADHFEVGNGLPDLAAQAFLELDRLSALLFQCLMFRSVHVGGARAGGGLSRNSVARTNQRP